MRTTLGEKKTLPWSAVDKKTIQMKLPKTVSKKAGKRIFR
jgi:hypothetical protein